MQPVVNLFWFRRDLRISDNAGLYHALKDKNPVVPIFIFDPNILDELEDPKDRRVEFIYKAVASLKEKLIKKKATFDVRYGVPKEIFSQLLKDYKIEKVFTNHDYEPYAADRDTVIADLMQKHGASFHTFKDQVIMERNEVLKDNGKPYTIFTPYSRRWKAIVNEFYLRSYSTEKYASNFFKQTTRKIPSLASLKFKATGKAFPSSNSNYDIIKDYAKNRDFPSIKGTSHLGIHLRFGTVSIRKLAREARDLNETFLNELIWRDFFQMILFHFPQVVSNSFKSEYDKIRWRNNEKEFDAWCNGQTGYPIVDAGMRELNETGFMHNRVRMITASFLTKHLLIDWRWGEAYFAKKLLDYELAANNGNWQWAAGTGCDAAPYFRIFNPYLQTKRFDPDLKYIRKWVPEFEEYTYPQPIVEHEFARKRCLEVYGKAVKQK
jgi:deoxyribodipyrimidine photo-lyase